MKRDKRRSALDEVGFMLQYRARSEQEVRQKLTDKAYEQEEIDAAVEKAREYGWIDDVAYAKRMMDSAASGNIKGKRSVSYRLKNKGISEEIVAQVMDEVDREDELAKAEKVCRGIIAKNQEIDRRKLREKLWRTLSYKGFDYEVISSAVQKTLTEDEY